MIRKGGSKMAVFPSLEWFKIYQKRLEQDEDFKKYSRWFKGSVMFRIDQASYLVKFDYGLVADVTEEYGDYDVMIRGPLASWKMLLNEDKTINRLYRYGILEIRGNPTEIMKNWKALFHITQCLKRTAKQKTKLGGA
jgi:hypothetical protein